MSKIEIKVPEIGESVTEVTLSQWLKEDGDYVERDENICEFESDKATLELPAEEAGTLHHKVEEGSDLQVGDVIAEIDTEGKKEEQKEEKEPAEEKEKEKSEAKEEHYAEGAASPAALKMMRENKLSAEDVTGKGKDGRITKKDVVNHLEGETEIRSEEHDSENSNAGVSPATDSTNNSLRIPDDEDDQSGVEVQQTSSSKKEKQNKQQPQKERKERKLYSRETSVKKMSRMRRTIAKRLVSAKNNTAMLTTFNEIDMGPVMQLRKKYQDDFVEKYGIKLGYMSLFAKACSIALQEKPEVNAMLEDENLRYHEYVDISIAISTENGLVVPPVTNIESKPLHVIEEEIAELAEKAREGTLSLEEMQGGTFTITNGGIFGSLMSTPILNEPQSAILGMHAIKERPVAEDGEIIVKPMMYVALSYDHRVIDGSTSVTFLVRIKELIENPVRLMMEL